ncbi:hypothetical protein ACFX11_035454 [Malus domestica]
MVSKVKDSMVEIDPKSTIGGGVEDVYGEDTTTEDQLVTPWTYSIASGYSLLRDPQYNKGLAFTKKENDAHYLRGLLPPTTVSQQLQAPFEEGKEHSQTVSTSRLWKEHLGLPRRIHVSRVCRALRLRQSHALHSRPAWSRDGHTVPLPPPPPQPPLYKAINCHHNPHFSPVHLSLNGSNQSNPTRRGWASSSSLSRCKRASIGPTLERVVTHQKIRLGSSPPSCRSKCGSCSPCKVEKKREKNKQKQKQKQSRKERRKEKRRNRNKSKSKAESKRR